jgi:hypothetical protein
MAYGRCLRPALYSSLRSSPSHPTGVSALRVTIAIAKKTSKIIETVLGEENRKPESIFDFVQGITALARGKAHQDTRLDLEGKAKRLMERAI